MNKNIQNVLLVIGLLFGGILLYKLIAEILKSSFHLWSGFLIFLNVVLTVLGICLGLILFFILLAGIVWSFELLEKKISDYFSNLNHKISELLKNKPEKILPIFIAAISQVSIFMLSKDFAATDSKAFLTVILSIILAIVLITTSRDKKRFFGVASTIILLGLTAWLMCAKYHITEFGMLITFVRDKWDDLTSMQTINMMSVGLIALSFIVLICCRYITVFERFTNPQAYRQQEYCQ